MLLDVKFNFWILTTKIFVLLLPVQCLAQAECVNLLQNPGFEEGNLLDGKNKYEAGQIPAWSLSSFRTKGNTAPQIEIHKNVNRAAAEGVAFLEFDTSKKVVDEIYQEITTEPNTEYEIKFFISKRNNVFTTRSNALYLVWNQIAEEIVSGGSVADPKNWFEKKFRLVSNDTTSSRIGFREIREGEFTAGDGKAPLIDNVSVCKIGPAPEPTGRVAGPPLDRIGVPEYFRTKFSKPWQFSGDYIEQVNGEVQRLSFSETSPIPDYGDSDPKQKALEFLEQYQSDLGLTGILAHLDGGNTDIRSTGFATVIFRQEYQGLPTGNYIEFLSNPVKKLFLVTTSLRTPTTNSVVSFPEDLGVALAPALTFLRADNIPIEEIQAAYVKWVYIDPQGNPKPLIRVVIPHPRINWTVNVDATTNEVAWAGRDLSPR